MGLISRVSSRTYREVSAKNITHSTNMFTSKMKKATDWTKLGWCMQEKIAVGSTSTSMFANGKSRFVQFKAASDQVLGKHSMASARPKTVDFAAYKAALPGQADWVSSMEKQYNETVIPKPADVLSEVVAADDESRANRRAILRRPRRGRHRCAGRVRQAQLPATKHTDDQLGLVQRFPGAQPYTAEEMAKHGAD